jgi:hypothetical protein
MNENTNDSSLESLTLNNNNKSIINNNEKEKSRIIKIIAELIKSICEEGKSNKDDTLLLVKPFISKKIPSISIIDYIERLLKYSKVSDNLFIFEIRYCINIY